MLHRRVLLLMIVLIIPLSVMPLTGISSEANTSPEIITETTFVQQAPEISVQDVDSGLIYSLSDFLGKIVILDLFATWCPPCQLSLPYLREVYSSYSLSDLQIISVDIDTAESQAVVSQFRQDEGMSWIVSLDPGNTILGIYGTGSIPTFYIIDQEGTVQWSDTGFTNEITKPAMEDTIKGLLEENPTNGNPGPSPTSKVFFIILEIVAGLAVAIAAVFGVYKLRQRVGIKNCPTCGSLASSKCAKCGILTCANCSGRGCKNCGSRQFIRL